MTISDYYCLSQSAQSHREYDKLQSSVLKDRIPRIINTLYEEVWILSGKQKIKKLRVLSVPCGEHYLYKNCHRSGKKCQKWSWDGRWK